MARVKKGMGGFFLVIKGPKRVGPELVGALGLEGGGWGGGGGGGGGRGSVVPDSMTEHLSCCTHKLVTGLQIGFTELCD